MHVHVPKKYYKHETKMTVFPPIIKEKCKNMKFVTLRTSVPLDIPPSMYTSTPLPFTADTMDGNTCGSQARTMEQIRCRNKEENRKHNIEAEALGGQCSTSMVAGAVSSWRAPWLDTQMPSTPCCHAARPASSGVITPFSTIFRRVTLRSHATTSHVSCLCVGIY